jgi:transposase
MSVAENDDASRGRCTAGIDWASEDHTVSIVDGQGVEVDRFTVEHTAAGLRQLIGRLRRTGVAEVGIERPDGPVVDALLNADLVVLVIAPNQIRGLRSRYGSAGNKDDSFDAFILADAVRTDRARLRPLTQDSPATVTLRMMVRARKDLIAARVAMANQLRAHLDAVLPGAVGLFRDIDSPISGSWPGSPTRTGSTGFRRSGCATGCAAPVTTTPAVPACCTRTSPPRPGALPGSKPPRAHR